MARQVNRFSTAAAVEELITPPVQVNHTKLLINGHFVDSASGKCLLPISTNQFCYWVFFITSYAVGNET